MECSEIDCAKPVHSRGLCQPHYRQVMRREKDAEVGSRRPGPAPDPSARRSRYKAKTRSLATDNHCANGHPWTDETIYQPPNGQRRQCRLCIRGSQQRYKGREVDTVTPIHPRGSATCRNGHEYPENPPRKVDGARICYACNEDNRRKQVYGLTSEQYAEMYAKQKGKCDTCKRAFKNSKDTHIDHEHDSGVVRAILCGGCNLILGHAGDDADRLRALAAYVETHHKRIQALLDEDDSV